MGRNFARLVTSPELAAHRIIGLMQPKSVADGIDVPGMLDTLREQAAAVQRGDLAHAEAMLVNQASALQALFARFSEQAMEQTHIPNLEGFMRLALKSQNQCRATLETLAYIKNPPAAFIRQQNVAVNQQVNNSDPSNLARAEVSKSGNELLNEVGHAALDSKRASTTGGIDSHLETVEAVHRRNNAGR